MPRTKHVTRLIAVTAALAVVGTACGGDDGEDSSSDSGGAAEATICVGGEFSTRPDGLPGLEAAYGFEFPADAVTTVDEDSLVYNEVDRGNCTFGSVAATDARIGGLGLVTLEDDEGFFPPFNGSLNVRTEVLEEYPEIEELFAPMTEEFTDEVMLDLNAQVDLEENDPEDVARDWLDDHPVDDSIDLSGASFTVGSKEFTEQLILGHLTKLALEDAGADVSDQIGLVGSVTVREALTSGEIDLYWEYLGTGWVTYLGNEESIPDSQEQYEAVRDADVENGVSWLPPAPFNNTYAIAVAEETAEELDITSISDIGPMITG